MKPGLGWRGRGDHPRSLRSELLFNLAFLAAAALFLALWTASVIQRSAASTPGSVGLLLLLVGLDILVFVALGNYLIERLVVRPLAETTAVARAIAAGELDRRAAPGRTQEVRVLAGALNHLTDQLLLNQERLAENVRSLDRTNRLLNETQRELVQAEKMASIGRLAAGVAHEVGNPLGALLGYLELVRRRGASPDLLDGIGHEAGRIDQIVRGLLEYARPGPAPREAVDANASVRRVVELLRRQGTLGGLELRLDLAPGELAVAAVPTRLDQVFLNLVRNADAAMGGRGRLTIVSRRERYLPDRPPPARRASDPPGVDYSHLRRLRYASFRDASRLAADREVVRILVADDGPGIAAEHIDSVFDPFFTTKAPGEGTGLGLAIVAASVAEMGGRVEVSSAPGAGATFTLTLPLVPETEDAAQAASPGAAEVAVP